MSNENLIHLFVLIGFFLQAVALLPYTVVATRETRLTFKHFAQWGAVISFAIALMLLLVGAT